MSKPPLRDLLPLTQLFRLERIDDQTFRSTASPFSPGSARRAYGGHVYAQAAWAAAQTVKDGFTIHNVSGFFTLPGLADVPFVYHVKVIRNGGSYCTRNVSVVQSEGKGIAFTATVSFKLTERSTVEIWEGCDLYKLYAAALDGRGPEALPDAPGIDTPQYRATLNQEGRRVDEFPGLRCKEADMREWNKGRPPLEKRQLYFYTPIGEMPLVSECPNMHAIAHLYASDRNSLYLIPNILGRGGDYTQMASISINVVFNGTVEDMDVARNGQGPKWFCQEAQVTWIGGGRGLHQSRIWSPEGRLLATSWQEGLVRFGRRDECRSVDGKVSRL